MAGPVGTQSSDRRVAEERLLTKKISQVNAAECTGCGLCVDICPESAIALQDSTAVIDQTLCRGCGTCIEECPQGAIEFV